MGKYVSEDNLSYYTSLVQGMPDGETIEYAAQNGQGAKSLRVKDGGIDDEQIASGKALVPLTGSTGQVLTRTGSGIGWDAADTSSLVLLWEGASNGQITVPGISNYSFAIVECSNPVSDARSNSFVGLCGWLTLGNITVLISSGIGMLTDDSGSSANTSSITGFAAKVSGETLIPHFGLGSSTSYLCIVNGSKSSKVNKIWGVR